MQILIYKNFSGPNGSIQIKVIRGDLSEATYPGVYSLQVTKFDIIDENQDGINEPGEHMLVHNIRVRNTGGMPSPEQRSIKLLIQGTQFLDPVIAEPLELPRAIQPGQEIEVPGVLRAYIKNEWSEKPLGTKLECRENVCLVAMLDERLKRPLPGFCIAAQTLITYPLTLDQPTYLDCVAKGDIVRFKWVLHNISNKAYGIESFLRRAAATKISDPNRFFNLTYASAEKPDEASDNIPNIQPNSMITIDQDFSVNNLTMEFSEGYLTLELMLADPLTGTLRSVLKHRMHMQISGKYSLSPNPSYLLVVNSKTPNHAIHQIITFVRQRLHTSLDIFNLSLGGSFTSPVTNTSVLRSYSGKSIIIFGNAFPYFNKGDLFPWILLDPWQTSLLLKARTNIFFASVGNMQSLTNWAKRVTFPAYDFSAGKQGSQCQNVQSVAAELKKTDPKSLTEELIVHRFPVTTGIFGTIQSTMDSKARKAAKALNKSLPLRRFLTVPDVEAAKSGKKTGGIIVCEGVPKSSNLIASVGTFLPNGDGSNALAPYHVYFAVSCLPFAVKARMFWNILGSITSEGVSCDIIYRAVENFYSGIPGQPAMVDLKVRVNDGVWSIGIEFYIRPSKLFA
jgi:hypothetical protein